MRSPWLARLVLLSELEARVQQGWFEDGRRTKQLWPRLWLAARQLTVAGRQASPGLQTPSVHGDGLPCGRALPLFDAVNGCCSPCCVVPKAAGITFVWTPDDLICMCFVS